MEDKTAEATESLSKQAGGIVGLDGPLNSLDSTNILAKEFEEQEQGAFAKMFNLFPNTQIDGPNYVDFTLPNGMTVDVKSTDNFSGNLLVPLHITSDNSADAFVLMRGTLEKGFEYVGWITREGYYEKATKRQMADDMPFTWCLSAGHLKHEPIIKPT
tara:strand:- start:129 stop:602 length:474 start_codon:yes stop_codon:yes gene_type:complete